LPDMSAKVAFLTEELPASQRMPSPAVNSAAVVERAGRAVAYVVRDAKAYEVPVQTGRRLGDMVEVTNGLRAGDKVILRPPPKLKDGAAIAIAKK
jgi:HlyD family secretion protein